MDKIFLILTKLNEHGKTIQNMKPNIFLNWYHKKQLEKTYSELAMAIIEYSNEKSFELIDEAVKNKLN